MPVLLKWDNNRTTARVRQKIDRSLRVLKSCGVTVKEVEEMESNEVTGLESLFEYLSSRFPPGRLRIIDTAIGRTVCMSALEQYCNGCPGKTVEKQRCDGCRQFLGEYLRTRRKRRTECRPVDLSNEEKKK